MMANTRDIEIAESQVTALSTWIDSHNAHRDPEAAEWGRIAKVCEEAGEVIQAFIAQTGQNPRKPMDIRAASKVDKELLDTALTAIAAWESRHGNTGGSITALINHIEDTYNRAALMS